MFPMSSKPVPTTEQMQALLTEATATLAQSSVGICSPGARAAQARQEADQVSSLVRSDGVTPWGTAPAEVVWKSADLLMAAVFEYSRGTAALLVPPFRAWSPTLQARAAIEAASQVAWLLDADLPDGSTRAGRYYALRLYAARRLEHTYKQVDPGDPLSLYGKSVADIEAEAASLCLRADRNKPGIVTGYKGQQFPGLGKLAALIVGDNGAYSLLSGGSHSELLALLGGYEGRPPSPLGLSAEEHAADAESFVHIVRACLQALFKSLDAAWMFFGQEAVADDLQRLYKKAVELLG